MTRERLVLRTIEQCLGALEHHPQLFSEFLVHGRSAPALARAFTRYRSERPEPSSPSYAGDELAERVDRSFEDAEARRRAEEWAREKQAIDTARRAARTATLAEDHRAACWELHKLLNERTARVSTVPAGNVEPGRGGSERAGPPRQQTADDDPRRAAHWYVIRRRLELLHELEDEDEGLGPQKQLTKEEKDRLILAEAGRTCQDVVDLLGQDIAGSVRTVWRTRKNTQVPDSPERRMAGGPVSTDRGLPIEDEPRPRPVVRRVVIDEPR